MNSRHIALLAFLGLHLLTPSRTFAADDAVTLQARARFKEGVAAFDKKDFETARLAFLQAYTLKRHPAVLLNLAQSSAASHHPGEAALYFKKFLAEATTATPEQRRDAATGLAEVRMKLGRIAIVAPEGTDISLDDQGKVGTTPLTILDVEPGPHAVKSPAEAVQVTVAAGEEVRAEFQDRPSAAAAAGASAGAIVLPNIPAPPDTSAAVTTTEPPPKVAAPPAPPPPPPPTQTQLNLLLPPKAMAPVYIGLGVGTAGLVGTVVFSILRSSAQADADAGTEAIRAAAPRLNLKSAGACNAGAPALAEACRTLRENNDRVDTHTVWTNISIGTLAAGVFFAGAWYIAAPKRERTSTARTIVTPWASADTGGISLVSSY